MNKNIMIFAIILISCLSFFSCEELSQYWEKKGLNPYSQEFWASLDYSTLTADDWKNIDFNHEDFPWTSFNLEKLPKFDFVNIEPAHVRIIFKNELNADFDMTGKIKTAMYENKNKTLTGNFGSFMISDYPYDKYRIDIAGFEDENENGERLIITPKKAGGELDIKNQIVLLGGLDSFFRIDKTGLMDVYLKEENDITISNRANIRVVLDDGSTYLIKNSAGSFTFNSKGEINAEDANAHLEVFNKYGTKIKDITGSFKMKEDIVMLTKKGSSYDNLILDLHFESNNEYAPEFAVIKAGSVQPDVWPFKDTGFWKKKGTELVHLYGYAEISENFVSMQGNGYIESKKMAIKINSPEPIANPDDFKTNRELVYNYINKGEDALAGEPEDKKIKTPLAIIDTEKEYDYAFGKIAIEDNEIKYSGLTSSTQFSKSLDDELNKDLVRIDGIENGRIAVFERGKEGSLNIIKDGNYVGIDADVKELLKDLDHLPDRELEIILGDEKDGAYFFINSDGDKTYNPGRGNKVSILSRVDALGALGDENSVLLEAQKLIDASLEKGGVTSPSTEQAKKVLSSLDSYIRNYEDIDEQGVLKAKIKRTELVMNYKLESYEKDWFAKIVQEYPEEEYKYTLQKNGLDIAENLILKKNVNYAKSFYRDVVDIDKGNEEGSEALDKLDRFASIEAIQYGKLQATEYFLKRISEIKGYKTVKEGEFWEELWDNTKKKIESGEHIGKVILIDLLSEIYGGAGPLAIDYDARLRDVRLREAEYNLATALGALDMVEKTIQNNQANDLEDAFALLENTAVKKGIKKVGNWERAGTTIPDFRFVPSSEDVNLPPEVMRESLREDSITKKFPAIRVDANDLYYLLHEDPYFSEFLDVIKTRNAGTDEEEKAMIEAGKRERLRGNVAGAITIFKNVGDSTSNPEIEKEAYRLYHNALEGLGSGAVMLWSDEIKAKKFVDNMVLGAAVDVLTGKGMAAIGRLVGGTGGKFGAVTGVGAGTNKLDNILELKYYNLNDELLNSYINQLDNIPQIGYDNLDDVFKSVRRFEEGADVQRLSSGICFVEGTKITMFDGGVKNIEDIKKGEVVLSYDIKNKKLVEGKVLSDAFERETDELVIINNKIKTTPQHPFFVINKNYYVEAEKLSVGDILLSDENEKIIIVSVEKKKLKEKIRVYNFDVDNEYDNYFADRVLAQNENPVNPCAGARDTAEILPPMKKYRVEGYEDGSIGPPDNIREILEKRLQTDTDKLIIPGTTKQGGVMRDTPLSTFVKQERPSQESFLKELARTESTKSSIPNDINKIGERLPYYSDARLNIGGIIDGPDLDLDLIRSIEVSDYELMNTHSWAGSANTERIINVVRINQPGARSRLVAIDRVSVTNLREYYDKFRSAAATKTAEQLAKWREINSPRLVIFDVGTITTQDNVIANIEKVRMWLNTKDTTRSLRLMGTEPRIGNVVLSH